MVMELGLGQFCTLFTAVGHKCTAWKEREEGVHEHLCLQSPPSKRRDKHGNEETNSYFTA